MGTRTKSTVNIPLTKVYVDNHYLGLTDCKLTKAYFYGITSIPGRQFLCHVMLEDGSNWYGLPLVALCTQNHFVPMQVSDYQAYDCFSYTIDLIRFDFLRDQRLKTTLGEGRYLFTVISLDPDTKAPFSEFPEQAKTFVFVELDNGAIITVPNNYIQWTDKALYELSTDKKNYKRIDTVYRSEK